MDSLQNERQNMVRLQLERRGITDKRILQAFREVPRHEFVPLEHRTAAYTDHPIPIGYGQTISQPYVVALMIQEVDVTDNDVVLDIGTGSGYGAAILSRLAKEVYSIERVEPLANESKRLLASLGYDNVHVQCGDGYAGWPEKAPFDVIILGAAPTEIPEDLKNQLSEEGRLIAPVGGENQRLVTLERKDGNFVKNSGTLVRFVPMKSGKQTNETSEE